MQMMCSSLVSLCLYVWIECGLDLIENANGSSLKICLSVKKIPYFYSNVNFETTYIIVTPRHYRCIIYMAIAQGNMQIENIMSSILFSMHL